MKLTRIALTPPIAAISVFLSVALGARAFGGDLPAEYDRLDYIDSDGSAGSCLVLDFGPETGTRIDLRTEAIDVAADIKFFGSYQSGAGVFMGTISSTWRVGYHMRSTAAVNGEAVVTCYLPGYDEGHASGAYFVNGAVQLYSSVDIPASVIAHNYGVFGYNVFASNKETPTPGKMRFYALKVTDSAGTVTHDLVPVRGLDGLGLYDLAAERFYPVPKAEAFTAGPSRSTLKISIVGSDKTYETIEEAYEAAAQDGDVIELAASEVPYRLTGRRLEIAKNVTIRGTGADPSGVTIWPSTVALGGYFFLLSGERAKLENLTFARGRTGPDNSWAEADHVLKMSAGTIDSCIVRNSSGRAWGGAVGMTGGTLVNSLICDNRYSGAANSNAGMGGGVTVVGGIVSNCVIRNNVIRHSGGGVLLCGPTAHVVDCVITNNSAANNGSGVYISRGLIERCRIAGNASGPNGVGIAAGGTVGAYPTEGSAGACTVRNCIIDRNMNVNTGAGVYLTTANCTFENCTIADNASTSAEGGGVYQTAGKLVNCIVVRNGGSNPTSQIANDLNRTGGTMQNCLTTEAIPAKGTLTDNEVGDPDFKDAPGGDYRLSGNSAAVDKGLAVETFSNDFARVERPQGEAWDIGAYEYVLPALDASISVERYDYAKGSEITLTAVVVGTDTSDLAYEWDFDGDGTVDSRDAVAVWKNADFGGYRPVLTVQNGSGDVATTRTADVVSVLPGTVYVATTGSNEYPYDTEEKAASDLQTAIDAVYATDEEPGTVIVAAGDYYVATDWIVLSKPVAVRGAGPAVSKVHAQNAAEMSKGTAGINYRRRVLQVNHPRAFVTGLGLADGMVNQANSDGAGPGGLRLIDGVVSNCWIYNNVGSDNSGGVDLQGGTLTHCEIFGNKAYRSNCGWMGEGGGVTVQGGLMRYCVVSNNTANGYMPNHKVTGSGINQKGGTVEDCLIAGNKGNTDGAQGVGVYLSAGRMERCRIMGNGAGLNGSGVFMKGTGVLRNALVTGNTATDNGAVYLDTGTIEHGTIAGNTSSHVLCAGLYQLGGTVRNSIIYNNAGNATGGDVSKTGGTLENCIYESAPGFVRVEADWTLADWHLAAGSPAIDAAIPDESNVLDVEGAMRPKDGNGDGEAVNDIGCYEAKGADEGPFSVAIAYTADRGLEFLETELTANPSGDGAKDLDNITYEWDVGEGGSVVSTPVDARTVTVRWTTYGAHSATVTARHGDDSASDTKSGTFKVGARRVHVSLEGDGTWPYASWESASSNLVDVLKTLVTVSGEKVEIVVADGTYPIDGTWAEVQENVYLHSVNGPASTTLKARKNTSTYNRVMLVNHGDAVVEGFTMTGGHCHNFSGDGGGPGGLRVIAGTVTNCVITGNVGEWISGGVEMRGGRLVGSVVSNNTAHRTTNASVGCGGGISVFGGTVEGCRIEGNYAQWQGGGIYMGDVLDGLGNVVAEFVDGLVRNCVLTNNVCGNNNANPGTTSTLNGGGAFLSAGLMDSCTVVGNKNMHYMEGLDHHMRGQGAVYVSGEAELRNSLVAGNLCDMGAQGILVEGANAKVVNCTVAGNGQAGYAYNETAYESVIKSGLVANTVIYGNDGEPATTGTATLDHSLVNVDPHFRNAARGDYRLKGCKSPGFDAGNDDYWKDVVDPLDLLGVSRLIRHVDIGCFECTTGGLMLLVK